MNPEQALNQVEEAIKNRGPSDTGKWHLTFYDGHFCLQPTNEKPTPWPIIAILSEDTIREGLANSNWNNIKNRIAKLIKIGDDL